MNDSFKFNVDTSDLAKGEINKTFILERVDQEEIFRHFLGHITYDAHFISGLRTDKNPTCSLSWYNGKLWHRDWSEPPPPIDCFSYVQRLHRVNFYEALLIIAKEMKLFEMSPKYSAQDIESTQLSISKNSKSNIKVAVKKAFTREDIYYLKGYGINRVVCSKFKCFSIQQVWINGKHNYLYKPSDPCLGYYFGVDEEGKQKWKLYFYTRKKYRFIGNTNRINGIVQLPISGNILIITKSMKDVMVLDTFGIPAIAMQSENTIPYDYIITDLKRRFKVIYSLYDFDRAGIHSARIIRKLYNIKAMFLTNGRFGTIDREAKDISDFVKYFGRDSTLWLIRKAIDHHNIHYQCQIQLQL